MPFPTSPLSGENVLRDVHDPENQHLRVGAEITAIVENVTVEVDLQNTQDSVAIGTSSQLFTGTTVGPKTGLDVNIINGSVVVEATDLDIRDLSFSSDKVDVSGSTVILDASSLSALESVSINNPSGVGAVNIQDGGNSITVDATDLDIRDLSFSTDKVDVSGSTINAILSDEPIRVSGTINGTPIGTEYTFVNNLRLQILATHDRNQDITYADFGTVNQRVTQIDYTSATFPGVTARKTLIYTLVGNKYRRDNIIWSII